MFEEFFQGCGINDPEKITQAQSENIRTALQKKLAADDPQPEISDKEKEENIMKSKSIRTVIIAAAVAVAGLCGAVGAAGSSLTREEITAELAGKNNVTPEFAEYAEGVLSGIEAEPNHFLLVPVSYGDMEIRELVVREYESDEFKGLYEENLPAIILEHYQNGGCSGSLITADGSGGYLNSGEPITDEVLLAAIAEGTERYGDTFVIEY